MCLYNSHPLRKNPESARTVSSRFGSYLPLQIQNKHSGRRHRACTRNESKLRVFRRRFDLGLHSFEFGVMSLNIKDVLQIEVTITPCRFSLNGPWRHRTQVKHLPELREREALVLPTLSTRVRYCTTHLLIMTFCTLNKFDLYRSW